MTVLSLEKKLNYPSKFPLIILSTLANGQKMRLLVDTGASSSFINIKSLQKIPLVKRG